jgi:hypothetical protein
MMTVAQLVAGLAVWVLLYLAARRVLRRLWMRPPQ